MRSRAEELIYKYFIDKFAEKKETFIGVEIEMPVINLNKQPVQPEFRKALVDLLVRRFNFRPVKFTLEGFPIEAVNENRDTFSFETTFNTIELAMGKKRSLNEIVRSFYKYLGAIIKLAQEHNHLVCGMGTNPYMQYADSKPLNTPSMLAKSEYLKKFTTHHDGEIFHAFSAATQTHLDPTLPMLPVLLNLLGRLAFVDGILFANSPLFPLDMNSERMAHLPPGLRAKLASPTLCFRDILWSECEAPNAEAYDGQYGCIGDIVNHLLDLKLFVVSDGEDGFKPIQPVKFAEYFAGGDHSEKDLACFRSLEPVAVSKHGTIEIRRTCTQPLAEIFVPPAFYLGIAENYQKVIELANDFWRESRITVSNSELRRRAVFQEMIAPPEKMRLFISSLVAISLEGLKKRNFGEEKYLGCLKTGDDFMESPARRQLRLLQEGWEYQEVILAYSRWGEREVIVETRK